VLSIITYGPSSLLRLLEPTGPPAHQPCPLAPWRMPWTADLPLTIRY